MEDVVLVVLFSVLRFLDALGMLAFINCWKKQMRKRQDCWIARRLWMCFIIIKLRIWRHLLNESISSYLYMRYIWTGRTITNIIKMWIQKVYSWKNATNSNISQIAFKLHNSFRKFDKVHSFSIYTYECNTNSYQKMNESCIKNTLMCLWHITLTIWQSLL